jgi:hypothetical protein
MLTVGAGLYLGLHIAIILCQVCLATLRCVLHSCAWQVLALLVAVNAHDASLLAILLSNQFIELKVSLIPVEMPSLPSLLYD